MLIVALHVWVTKKIFHSRLLKTALNSFFLTFLSYCKTSDLHPIPEDCYEKEFYIQELCKESFDNTLN